MRKLLVLTLLILPTLALAASDADLMRDEQLDAARRQKQDLNERLQAMQQQAQTIKELNARQDQLLEQLKAQINALQDGGDKQ